MSYVRSSDINIGPIMKLNSRSVSATVIAFAIKDISIRNCHLVILKTDPRIFDVALSSVHLCFVRSILQTRLFNLPWGVCVVVSIDLRFVHDHPKLQIACCKKHFTVLFVLKLNRPPLRRKACATLVLKWRRCEFNRSQQP